MRERTLRLIVLVCFLGLVGASVGSCIVRTKRDRHGHYVKHRKHKKVKKHRKHRKHNKHRRHRRH